MLNKVSYLVLSSSTGQVLRSIYVNGKNVSTEIIPKKNLPLEIRQTLFEDKIESKQ